MLYGEGVRRKEEVVVGTREGGKMRREKARKSKTRFWTKIEWEGKPVDGAAAVHETAADSWSSRRSATRKPSDCQGRR